MYYINCIWKKPDHDINIMLHTGEKECVQNIFTQSAPRFVEAVLAATDIQAPLASQSTKAG